MVNIVKSNFQTTAIVNNACSQELYKTLDWPAGRKTSGCEW